MGLYGAPRDVALYIQSSLPSLESEGRECSSIFESFTGGASTPLRASRVLVIEEDFLVVESFVSAEIEVN